MKSNQSIVYPVTGELSLTRYHKHPTLVPSSHERPGTHWVGGFRSPGLGSEVAVVDSGERTHACAGAVSGGTGRGWGARRSAQGACAIWASGRSLEAADGHNLSL